MRRIECHLGSCRSTSFAVIRHPDAWRPLPSWIPNQARPNWTFWLPVEDPLIKDLSTLILTNSVSFSHHVFLMQSRGFWNLHGTQSPSSPGKLPKQYSKEIHKYCDDSLSWLSVQSKFLDACDLEKSNRVWARILDGLYTCQAAVFHP